jgi:hypothetical protein
VRSERWVSYSPLDFYPDTLRLCSVNFLPRAVIAHRNSKNSAAWKYYYTARRSLCTTILKPYQWTTAPREGNVHYRGTNSRLEINEKIIFKFHDENGKHFVNEDKEAYWIDQGWHERYGHLPLKQFSKIGEAPRGIVGRSISCDVCEKGKSTKAASPKQ